MKYRKKIREIEAFQITKENKDNRSSLPSWLQEAFDKKMIYQNPGEDWLTIKHEELCWKSTIISWNDYIVKDDCGELWHWNPRVFENTYEAVTQVVRD